MDRIGIFFGGKSTEHEVSCISAAAVIRAIDKEKHELVYIGINKEGKWFRYEGSPDNIEDGTWEETAEPMNMGDLPGLIDFALPIMHGAYGEDGKLQGVRTFFKKGEVQEAIEKIVFENVYTAPDPEETTSVTVTKVWDDDENRDGKRPDKVTVGLRADGGNTGRSAELSAANDWQEAV